jgi:hypothetical protein
MLLAPSGIVPANGEVHIYSCPWHQKFKTTERLPLQASEYKGEAKLHALGSIFGILADLVTLLPH